MVYYWKSSIIIEFQNLQNTKILVERYILIFKQSGYKCLKPISSIPVQQSYSSENPGYHVIRVITWLNDSLLMEALIVGAGVHCGKESLINNLCSLHSAPHILLVPLSRATPNLGLRPVLESRFVGCVFRTLYFTFRTVFQRYLADKLWGILARSGSWP